MDAAGIAAKIKDDHEEILKLFQRFETSQEEARARIVEEALEKLERHTIFEEDSLYPAIRASADDGKLVDQAIEEHYLASVLARDLRQLEPSDPRYATKFAVLMKLIRGHIQEEEKQMRMVSPIFGP